MLINKSSVIALVIILIFSLSSCIEKYWPDIDNKYLELLVVDGMITNDPGPYTIRLSGSSSVDFPEEIPITNYHVEIQDQTGEIEILKEVEAGVYQSSVSGIQGIVGHAYKLIIVSPEGKSYESAFETISVPVEIQDVYANLESRQDTSTINDLIGYQFYLNTQNFSQDTNYILWNLKQTYEYRANLTLDFLYDQRRFIPLSDPDSLRNCWKTSGISEIFTFMTDDSKGKKIDNFPLHYVSTRTKELSIRYSLLVNQLTINRTAYQFWKSLSDMNTGDGSIYVQQPNQLRSNILNTEDPHEIVLGYFLVAGSSKKRIYLNRPTEIFYYQTDCFINFDGRAIFWSSPDAWPLYITQTTDGRRGIIEPSCFDCRDAGGVLIKPSFWVN